MISRKIIVLIILVIFLFIIMGLLYYHKEGWRWGRRWGGYKRPYWGHRPYWNGAVWNSPDPGNCRCINDETIENNCDYSFKPFCNDNECVCG